MSDRPAGFGSGLGLGAVLLAVALGLAGPTPVRAQAPELDRVQSLIESGRFASARTELQGWLDARGGTADRAERQRSIWLRALLTVDPGMAELDYRRLVVEYPGGVHSDEALLRLARIARARADDPVARGYLENLIRDYPQSPQRVEARSLLAEIEEAPSAVALVPEPQPELATEPVPTPEPEPVPTPDPEPMPDPEPVPTPGRDRSSDSVPNVAAVPSDVPMSDSIPQSEPSDVSPEPIPPPEPEPTPDLDRSPDPVPDGDPAPSDVTRSAPDPAPEPTSTPPDVEAAPFTVQLGAFSVPTGARTIAERAAGAGFEVRLVQVEGSTLIRVRTGAFVDRATAQSRVAEIQAAGLDAVASGDRAREFPYEGP